mgnify:CR=1 FL=1
MTERAKIPYEIKLLLAALACGTFAFSVLATVIGLQVFEITDSERDLGLVGLAQFVPILLLTPYEQRERELQGVVHVLSKPIDLGELQPR